MGSLYNLKESLKEIYANHSIWIDRAFRLLLSYFVLSAIGKYLNLRPEMSSIYVVAIISIVCAFLSVEFIGVIAAVMIVLQIVALSPIMAGVMASIFLLMFIFYLRFAPGKIIVVLLTPLAFLFNIPTLIPIIFGLVEAPVVLIPMVFGAIIYNMLSYISHAASMYEGMPAGSEKLRQISLFFSKTLENGSFWTILAALVLCYIVVYSVRRLDVAHSPIIAVISGALVNLIVMVVGDIRINLEVSYGRLIFTLVVAVIVGIVLQFFIFSVDYTRMEKLQFEDDEYYYYVKAVPKIYMAPKKKTVKTINEHSGNTIAYSSLVSKKEDRDLMMTQADAMKTKIREEGIEPLTLNETREMLLSEELEEGLKKEMKSKNSKQKRK